MSAGRLLAMSGISTCYGKRRVLHDVNVCLDAGEIVALIGRNAAGKSTLLKAIMGLTTVDRGTIMFEGNPTFGCSASQLIRMGIGYLPQGAPTFDELTVRQNLSIAALRVSARDAKTEVQQMLDLFPSLGARSGQAAAVLSGGERQMLGLARSFMGRPRLLLLDEPSLGLHSDVNSIVFSRIRELNQRYGVAVLMVEQNMNGVREIASRAYGIRLGKICGVGDTAVYWSQERLRDLFLTSEVGR